MWGYLYLCGGTYICVGVLIFVWGYLYLCGGTYICVGVLIFVWGYLYLCGGTYICVGVLIFVWGYLYLCGGTYICVGVLILCGVFIIVGKVIGSCLATRYFYLMGTYRISGNFQGIYISRILLVRAQFVK